MGKDVIERLHKLIKANHLTNRSIRQDINQSGYNINTASGNVSVDKIVHDYSVNVVLPKNGYEKIINSEGRQTTIEAYSFDIENISKIEAENQELREKINSLKDVIIELQSRLVSTLTPKINI